MRLKCRLRNGEHYVLTLMYWFVFFMIHNNTDQDNSSSMGLVSLQVLYRVQIKRVEFSIQVMV